ncbi:hypothetical protein AUK10_01830 [Candidatus Gracilibacteria bacterium CG2_30_37_12]|nr:MAG: hypothetical protein AUK10_01830 [Candidatus Gracilibacteria bacterium CG2_30_37_12]
MKYFTIFHYLKMTSPHISEQDTFEQFKRYFRAQEKPEQVAMIREYVGDVVGDFLEQKSGRQYCESLVRELEFLETRNLYLEKLPYEQLIDEVETFFEQRKTRTYPQWQRDILAFITKKTRK